jgi:hypothetical protein
MKEDVKSQAVERQFLLSGRKHWPFLIEEEIPAKPKSMVESCDPYRLILS